MVSALLIFLSAPQPLPADLMALQRALQDHGFEVRFVHPPVPKAYGLFRASERVLWVSPMSFALGIGRQTFLHEAVHAVQSCPAGVMQPIGWSIQLTPLLQREISGILTTRYHHGNRQLELEAFSLQGQADAVPKLLQALRERCGSDLQN